jgi:hypothetical protein
MAHLCRLAACEFHVSVEIAVAPSDLQRANFPCRREQPWPRQTPVRTDMSSGASELSPNGVSSQNEPD